MQTLQELTGQESGIVIYSKGGGQPEAVICNWSNVHGFPRMDPLGLTVLGFGEEIPEAKGRHGGNIAGLLEGVEIVFANGEDMPEAGTVYELQDGEIIVIAPDDWN